MTDIDREPPVHGHGADGRGADGAETLGEDGDDAIIGVALRRSLAVIGLVALAAAATWWLTRPETTPAARC